MHLLHSTSLCSLDKKKRVNVHDNIAVFNKKELENNWHHENEDAFIALNIFMFIECM